MTRAPILGMISAVVIEKLLIPPIDRIRAEAPGLIDNLPAADPSRLLLDRYHRLSTSFFAAEIAVAIVVLVVTARVLAAPSAPSAPKAPAAARPPIPKLLDLSDPSDGAKPALPSPGEPRARAVIRAWISAPTR